MRRGLDSGLARAELVYEECAERVRILRHERNRTLAVRKAELRNAHRFVHMTIILLFAAL